MATTCLFCGRPVVKHPEQTTEPLFPLLFSCAWCHQPFTFSQQEANNLSQCCECGIMLNGPCTGTQCLDANGKPNLSIGVSHGMCPSCAEKVLTVWRKKRLTRKLTHATLVSL